MHDKDDNMGMGMVGYDAEGVRKNLLRGTAAAFLAFTLLKGGAGDIACELFELCLLAIFGSRQVFNLICRVTKRLR
jgi:hypothetical protein